MLSDRLQAVLDWVQAVTLADIGTDHGYIPIEAVLAGKARMAYACDINPGPLENAARNIQSYHMEDRVIPILSNGLENVPACDQIVIAGMGAELMIQILSEKIQTLEARFLLLPHKDAPLLREFLLKNGCSITKERVIQEGKHFYWLMDAQKGSQSAEPAQLLLGIRPIEDETYLRWLKTEEKKTRNILLQADLLDKEEYLHLVQNRLDQIRQQSISE